jgi:integrase
MALTSKRVERLRKPGRYPDGLGLYLQVMSEKNRSWIFRFERDGKEFAMGLGPLHTISLKEAREKARVARQQLLDGINPLVKKREDRAAAKVAAAKALTFGEAAEKYFAAQSPGWKSVSHVEQWSQSILGRSLRGTPCAEDPTRLLRSLPVAAVDLAMVLKVIEPLWSTKTETATRIRARIEAVLAWATVRGFRFGPNPAQWKNHLDKILAPPSKVAKTKPHAALAYDAVPEFMTKLRRPASTGFRPIVPKALAFAVLTATRRDETRLARWSEIDLAEKIWNIPGARMKNSKLHRVPLSPPVIELLKSLPHDDETPPSHDGGVPSQGFVFIGSQPGKPIGVHAMLLELRASGEATATLHGFRSSFSDWAYERNYDRIAIELSLAHSVGTAVEQAYRRTDLLEARRKLMNDWATFCMTTDTAKVTPMRRRPVGGD